MSTSETRTGAAHILADGGKSDFAIVIAADASPPVRKAANEIRSHLTQATGADLPIVKDTAEQPSRAILVGRSAHLENVAPELQRHAFAPEAFAIRSVGEHIVIVGGEPRGTLYGAYRFLEDVAGVRWFTHDVTRVPEQPLLAVEPLDIEDAPALEYREPFFREAFDGDWSARNRSNSANAGLTAEHGGKVKYGARAFVHTFDVLVPVAKYFKEHPEYFSLIDGKRTDDHTQLCLTNPDVLKLAIEGVRQWIKDDPEANIFSVSQNDWYNPCQCDGCKEIDEREESHAGTMLWFVNQVADAIADEAPHVAIDTLAYQYTRKPPKTITPRPNVIVRLCSIECCFAHSLESDCPENKAFVADIEGWRPICDRLYIWDYVTNFRHYVLPWPNFGVLGPNVRFFARNNVVGLFEQGSYAQGGVGEFAELRSYVLAKLLWNPDVDEYALRDEFLGGVFGNVAPIIKQYHDLIHEPVKDPGMHIHIFCEHDNGHIPDDVVAKGEELLAEAEAKAESDAVRRQVEKAHLPIQYVRIRRMDDGSARAKLIERFAEIAKREGMTDMGEARPLDRWLETGAREPVH
jgi:hypothetical protein